MENESGLHQHANHSSNHRVVSLNESEGQVIKTLDNIRGAMPVKDSAKLSKRSLINIINHIHFTQEFLWAHIQGHILKDNLLVKLYPGPCLDDQVLLSLPASANINLQGYSLQKLIIEDGKRATIIPAILSTSTASSITVALPDHGYCIDERKNKRLLTSSIACEIQQDEYRVQGLLREFSVSGFRVECSNDVDPFPIILNSRQPVTVRMYNGVVFVYEGLCRIVRDRKEQAGHFLVLNPLQRSSAIQDRPKEKRIRNERLNLIPTPKVIFEHPISHVLLSYEIFDITTSGFSLNEHVDECLLLPGMNIPEVKLLFSSSIQLPCSAQILHARKNGNVVRVGFAIRDMDWTSCIKLCDIIANAIDPHANMNTVNNMDALWEIFFDTGFIYPQKYQYLSNFRDDFKENYRRLYQSDRKDVAFHFTYQENNRIYQAVEK